jgi:hypothetical protein
VAAPSVLAENVASVKEVDIAMMVILGANKGVVLPWLRRWQGLRNLRLNSSVFMHRCQFHSHYRCACDLITLPVSILNLRYCNPAEQNLIIRISMKAEK